MAVVLRLQTHSSSLANEGPSCEFAEPLLKADKSKCLLLFCFPYVSPELWHAMKDPSHIAAPGPRGSSWPQPCLGSPLGLR